MLMPPGIWVGSAAVQRVMLGACLRCATSPLLRFFLELSGFSMNVMFSATSLCVKKIVDDLTQR